MYPKLFNCWVQFICICLVFASRDDLTCMWSCVLQRKKNNTVFNAKFLCYFTKFYFQTYLFVKALYFNLILHTTQLLISTLTHGKLIYYMWNWKKYICDKLKKSDSFLVLWFKLEIWNENKECCGKFWNLFPVHMHTA